MARKERISRGRSMKPTFFVFCEGDTEVAYVELLRAHYRLPIHIIAKKTLLNITPALVERCKAMYVPTKGDRTYLMYDLDIPEIQERLQKIPGATLLCSNPCFEVWLLLHYVEVKTELSSEECVKRLSAIVKDYKKGTFSAEWMQQLMEKVPLAIERAKKLTAFHNPSTSIYRLIEDLVELSDSKKK